MAHLAIVGSPCGQRRFRAAQRACCSTTLVPEFAELWPEKFSNKTNGVAPRRWLLKANPELCRLLHEPGHRPRTG